MVIGGEEGYNKLSLNRAADFNTGIPFLTRGLN